MPDNERSYYEQVDLWTVQTAESAAVFETISCLWPDDVESVLDVGCGNGAISNQVKALAPTVIGGDFSTAALAYVEVPVVLMSAHALPFADASFDLVMTTDVLEHLPAGVLETALSELARVARKYVLICVPQDEPMAFFGVSCRVCGHRFHAHHHQRINRVDNLTSLEGFRLQESASAAGRWTYASNERAAAMRALSGSNYPFANAVCPACGCADAACPNPPGVVEAVRRFECLEYLMVESGLSPAPCRSEVLVLLRRAPEPSGPLSHPSSHDDGRRPQLPTGPVRIAADTLSVSSVMETFPDSPFWVGNELTRVLAVPRAPRRIEIVRGTVEGVLVFDGVDQRYVPAVREGDHWDLPISRPDSTGYRVQMTSPDFAELEFELSFHIVAPDYGSAVALAFGTTASAHYRWSQIFEERLVAETARADSNAALVDAIADQLAQARQEAEVVEPSEASDDPTTFRGPHSIVTAATSVLLPVRRRGAKSADEGVGVGLRVFHGPNNISGAAGVLAAAQRRLGWNARSICFPSGPFAFPTDELLPYGFRGRSRLLKAVTEFDVFHFYYGESLAGARLTDVALLRRMGKKVFFYFCGCDIRDSKRVIAEQPFSACAECWPMGCSANRDLAARVAEEADGCFVSTPDLLEFLPSATLLPQPIDLAAFAPLRQQALAAADRRSDEVVRVVHAPSNRTIKGTKYVEQAIEQLQADGVPVELVLVEGRSHTESLAIYASCDIAVDQMLIGAYGQFAIETMALGLPVVCFLRDDVSPAYAQDLPIVNARPDTLAERLAGLIADRATMEAIGAAGPAYVSSVHEASRVAQRAIDAYERVGAIK